ncbi:MAG TPA: hypothetical protein VIK52_09780, partial [Opitutaceae bacterium]
MKSELADVAQRNDIVPQESRKLSIAIDHILKKSSEAKAKNMQAVDRRLRTTALDQERLKVRKDLIEGRATDPNGFERVIGESDLTSINFLDRGRR